MVRQSIIVSEGREDPKYTSTYLEAVIDGYIMGICFTEATNSILRWMDISGDISSTIRSTLPTCIKIQPLKVFFSSGPAEYDTLYPIWLRNTLIVDFPENKYHVHLKGEAGMDDESTRFDEFVDKRFTWIPMYAGGGEPDSKSPGIGILRDDENDPDKALHIFHITVGAFVVHLVGQKDAAEFDYLANALKEMKWGLLFEAGHIHILADLEEEHAIPPPYWECL